MARAMLSRVRRLEQACRAAAAAGIGASRPERLAIAQRLAAHRDLFYEFAAIAEGAGRGIDRARIGRLAAALTAREARA